MIRTLKRFGIIGFLSILIVGCFPVRTDNPDKAWKYWSGSEPPAEVELIKGEYYQSPHFSLEYELFLKFKTNKEWFIEFVTYNNLRIDTIGNDWTRWTELPIWFNPNQDFIKYSADQADEFERSRYFFNPETSETYIYETVGM
ncbi:MAG: hypothetical protein CL840_21735 [Crocinitomicaceae bacterium]|nr:hypothetical protein [Crocinitomicaceae bacterium]|tara:strand:+ start:8863 stop:9291 length:429 start_codon:yes stop_codon:yes gene_type:complete